MPNSFNYFRQSKEQDHHLLIDALFRVLFDLTL